MRIRMANIDPDIPENKHLTQAVNHLEKVLEYAPMVAEGREATVHLTPQDWQVVADALFNMNAPDDAFPAAILEYGLTNENQTITLTTNDYDIEIEVVAG
jgi:CRISPR/Cas system Type II protein with McrA/HNH and RuvC-like nuclease domain